MGRKFCLLVMLVLSLLLTTKSSLAEQRGTHWMNVGDSVQVDIIMASTPGGAMWRAGKILEVHQADNSYVVEVEGSKRTIINNDQWIKAGAAQQAPQQNHNQQAPAEEEAGQAGQTNAASASGKSSSKANFSVGDSVKVDMIMASSPSRAMWTTGKIVGMENGSLKVLTPDGITRTIINNSDWIRPGNQAAPGPAAPPEVLQPVPDLMKGTPAGNTAGGATAGTNNHAIGKPGNGEWNRETGKGAPPNGTYECHKLSGLVMGGGGRDIDLGKLEIRGNSYRGIESSGAMSPFTVNGEQINWSNGIDGLPRGWAVVSSKYIGADERGRPLIRIFYRAATRGALECIDCYRP